MIDRDKWSPLHFIPLLHNDSTFFSLGISDPCLFDWFNIH